jgi:prolyl-tRNA editing enzyme YbaK/EbsC (Cys-tRNA(Pro) deacylase)
VTLSKGVTRFLEQISPLTVEVTEMPDSTHTALEAAQAVGVGVEAIVKSLVFLADGAPLLVLASGPTRVNVESLGQRLGVTLEKADADTVKAHTGYSIGGVPPFGHLSPIPTVMDEDFMALEVVWAAAGSAKAVFPLSPEKLLEYSRAKVVRVD